MTHKISLIAQLMLPKPLLPDRLFPLVLPRLLAQASEKPTVFYSDPSYQSVEITPPLIPEPVKDFKQTTQSTCNDTLCLKITLPEQVEFDSGFPLVVEVTNRSQQDVTI